MQLIDRFRGHLHTINHHKVLVMKTCFRVGLYRQGLLHDLSKYHPMEFLPGVKYFQGNRSPVTAEKEENIVSYGWLHHKGRNPHHFEYWIDYSIVRKADEGGEDPTAGVADGASGTADRAAGVADGGREAAGTGVSGTAEDEPIALKRPMIKLIGMKMPRRYVAEMVIDRMSASKNYLKDKYRDSHPLEYYMRGRSTMLIHPETDYLTRYLLTMLAKKGEEETLSYIKHRLLRHPDRDYHVRGGRLYLD